MGVRFTEEQQSVIDARGQSLLVSAAAGSGKTAVLVERIIRLITEPDEDGKMTDIDRLLVVTFTHNAAQQMKERVLEAVRTKLSLHPDDAHLQRQETLLHNAQITTIHAFCQFIVRSHFHEIDLDPGFRIGDDGEMKLLRQKVLEDLLEEAYAEGAPDFQYFSEYFATASDDKKLEKEIVSLYDFAMSMPWPEDWITERKRDYDIPKEGMKAYPALKELGERTKQVLEDCAKELEKALLICERQDGPHMYAEMIASDLSQVQSLLHTAGDYEKMRAALLAVSYVKLSSKKDDAVSAQLRKSVKDIRDREKKVVEELMKKYYAVPLAVMEEHMRLAQRAVRELCDVTIRFKERFDAAKREENLIDFNDLEHLALSVLLRREQLPDGSVQVTPSETAAELRGFFKEVMIDEYQDSNNVQELLLSSVSGEADGIYNRFMVGDVKQSIYKFRLARPEIFMEKMKTYECVRGTGTVTHTRRIDLHKNFRSRKEVLNSVNYCFAGIMGEDLGGVAYDEDACLVTGNTDYPEKEGCTTELLLLASEKNSAPEEEARLVAKRINEMVANETVTDKDGRLRPVRYSDIVILLRKTSGVDSVYKKVLAQEGIPAYTETKAGYFRAREVMHLIELLRIIDNPLQDIPFVSAAHSFFGGFDDEALARIRAAVDLQVKHYYEVFREYVTLPDADETLCDKVNRFMDFLQTCRAHAHYLTANELLEEILTTTSYRAYCAALPAGEQRLANINMLLERAGSYVQNASASLSEFVRYIEQLNRYEVDYGEANTLDEHADVLRIMSIHKSKGLEFKVVFVSGLSKKFNLQDTTESIITDVDAGIGVHAIDLEQRIQFPTLKRTLIADKMVRDSIGEELRVLYVAMTRAQEKLILTATDAKLEETLAGIATQPLREAKMLSLQDRETFRSYYRFLMAVLADHSAMQEFMKAHGVIPLGDARNDDDPLMQTDFLIRRYDLADLTLVDTAEATTALLRKEQLLSKDAQVALSAETNRIMEEVKTRMTTPYPHPELSGLFTKTTVTELKAGFKALDISEPGDAGESAGRG
ncbi:MAG: helicase-exonuclease AddAB subunit AddA, partial [Lachnospiraceae bacterium]|nr:helicase-exonuclease AddAB subunit AddA [Lachnospiraceae bacterium]